MKKGYCVFAGLLMICSQQVLAHGYEMFGDCIRQDAKTIRCTGGVNGKPLAGLRIDVLSDGDAILVRGRLDADGAFSFDAPSAPFYVLIEAKPGLVVVIDDGEIE